MGNGYPVSYRDGAPASSGSQDGAGRLPPSRRSPGRASNESARTPVNLPEPKLPLRDLLGMAGAMAGLARRSMPWFNGALLAGELYQWWSKSQPPSIDLSGWTLVCTRSSSGWIPGGWYWSAGTCTGASASVYPGVPPVVPGVDFPGATRIMNWGSNPTLFPGAHGQVTVYKRNLGAGAPLLPGVSANYSLALGGDPASSWLPSLDPDQLPITQPGVDPDPVPWWLLPSRQFNPYRAPGQQRQAGYAVPEPEPIYEEIPTPVSPGQIGQLEPSVPGAPGVSVSADPQSGLEWHSPSARNQNNPRKPRWNEREKKTYVAAGAFAARIGFNFATEADDFITAIWKAVPIKERTLPPGYVLRKGVVRKTRRPKQTPQQMASDIWRYVNKVGMSSQAGQKFAFEAIDNLVANQVEDYVFGKIGRKGAEASGAAGLSHGLQLGPAM